MNNEVRLDILPEYRRASIWTGDGTPFDRFILSGVQENIGETVAIHNTRDKMWVKGLGFEPSYKTYTGIVPLDHEFDFQELYLNQWRATKCIENNTTVRFKYSNVINIGVIDLLSISIESNKRYATFQMRQLVTNTKYINDYCVEPILEEELREIHSPVNRVLKATITRGSRDEGYKYFALSNLSKTYREKIEFNDRGTSTTDQYPNYNTATAIYTYGQYPITYELGLFISRELFDKPVSRDEETDSIIYERTTGEAEFYQEYIKNYSITQGATDIYLYYMNRCVTNGIIMNPSVNNAAPDTVYVKLNYLTNKTEYYLFSYLGLE